MQTYISLFEALKKEPIDAILVSSSQNIIYITGYSNFSKVERDAFLLVSKNNIYILTSPLYKEAVMKLIPFATYIEISSTSPLRNAFEKIKSKENIEKLGIETNNITVSEYVILKKHFKLSNSSIIEMLRQYKTKYEIEKIKKACAIGDKAFLYILKQLRVGVTEKDIAYLLTNYIRKLHAEISFEPIIAFGKNSSDIHHQPTNSKLTKNNFVLFDFGVSFKNYCSDMSRTIFFGIPNEKQKELYNTVLLSQNHAIKTLKTQITKENHVNGSVVDQAARGVISKTNFPLFPHGTGHGIGLAVHENPRLSPKSTSTLINGMVFTIEPGIYIEGEEGVRIEDMFVIVNNKILQLTKSSHAFLYND